MSESISELVIFDIGKVLINADFPVLYAQFAKAIGVDPKLIAAYHKDNIKAMLVGDLDWHDYLSAMQEHCSLSGKEIEAKWIEVALEHTQVNMTLFDVVDKLRRAKKICTLTNLTHGRKLLDEHLNVYSHFDENFLSCEEQLMKPDPNFFKLPLNKFAIRPEQAVFIDDDQRHVNAAKKLGIKALLFVDNSTLIAQLQDLRLL